MVTAVRKINPETNRELVNILFDSKLNVKPKVRICQNELEAKAFIEKQYAFAIRTALIRFAKQQEFIIGRYPSAIGAAKKLNAAACILKEMEHHTNSSLIVLASSVYWMRGFIYDLAPTPRSKYRVHYNEFIYPIVDWCFFYSKKERTKVIDREKARQNYH